MRTKLQKQNLKKTHKLNSKNFFDKHLTNCEGVTCTQTHKCKYHEEKIDMYRR